MCRHYDDHESTYQRWRTGTLEYAIATEHNFKFSSSHDTPFENVADDRLVNFSRRREGNVYFMGDGDSKSNIPTRLVWVLFDHLNDSAIDSFRRQETTYTFYTTL